MRKILGLFVLVFGLAGLMSCKKPQPDPQPEPGKTDQEVVDAVFAGLVFENLDGLTNESARLIFPTTKDGTTIEWQIDSDYILPSGMINQPTHDVGDQVVTITATIKKGEATKEKTFKATVLALPKPSEQQAYLDEDFKGYEDGDIIPQTTQVGVWGVVSGKAGNSTFHVVSEAPKPIPEGSKALKVNAYTELQIEAGIAHDVNMVVFEADFLQTPGAKAIQLQNHTSGSGSTFAFGITGSSVYYRIDASGEVKPEGNIANGEWFRLRVELDYANKTFELFKYVNGNLVSLSGVVAYTGDVAVDSLYIRSGSSNETSLNPNSSYITNIRVNRIEALPRPEQVIKLGEITGIEPTLSLKLGTDYTPANPVVKGLYGSADTLVLDKDYKVEVAHELDKDVIGEYIVTYTITNLYDNTDVKVIKQTVTVYSDQTPNEIQTATSSVVGYEEQTTDLTISFVRAEGTLYYAFADDMMSAEAIKAVDKKVVIDNQSMVIKALEVTGKNLYVVVENETGFSAVKELVLVNQTVVEVTTAEEFYQMTQTTTEGLYYVLKNDIDFTDYNWVYKNESFRSTFNGDNFSVKNITIDGTDRAGIFSRLNGATIKNLVVENLNAQTTNRIGGLVGEVHANEVTIENIVMINATIKGADDNGVAGIAGFVNKTTLNIANVSVVDSHIESSGKTVSAVVGRVEGAAATQAHLNLSDVFVSGVTVVSTSSATSDVGVSALLGYIRNKEGLSTLKKAVIVDTKLVGPMAGAVIGYAREGAAAVLADIYVQAGITFSDARAGLVGRYNNVDAKYDVSKVYGKLTFSQTGYEDAPHAESSMLIDENILEVASITRSFVETTLLLDASLWDIKDTGAPVLKHVLLLLIPTHTVTIKFNDDLREDLLLSVKDGDFLSFEAPEIIGYEFIDLYTDEGRMHNFSWTDLITSDLTLYAKYEVATTAKVSFDTLGGPEVARVTVNIGGTLEAFPVVENTLFEGVMKKVVGWTLNGEAFNISTPITTNITLVAVWEDVTYTVTVNGVEQIVKHGEFATEGTLEAHEIYPEALEAYWVSGGSAFTFDTPITSDLTITQAYKLKDTVEFLEITTAEQLHFMVFEGESYAYKLMNDLDLSTFTWSIPAETKFSGSFDGGNFTISNLTTNSALRSALFPIAQSGTIKNVVIDNANMVSTNQRNAVLIGEVEGTGTLTIENIVIKNSAVQGANGNGVGGLIGFIKNDPTINITNVAILNTTINNTTEKYAGGLIARAEGGTINAVDIYIKDIKVTTFRTGTDAGSAAIFGYIRNAATMFNANRIIVDNATLNGDATGAVIGYNRDSGSATLTDVFVKATLNGVQRSAGIVTRYNQEPAQRIDASDVYGILTGIKANSQSQQLEEANNVTDADLTQAWWTTHFTLGDLWAIPETGVAMLKIAQ